MKVCFAGNPDSKRAGFIENVARAGIEIDVYGNHWSRFVNNPLVVVHQPVYGAAFWKILSRYRVQLNLMRTHNEGSHNMRSFEVPAIGGIMLAPDTQDHRLYFKDREEVFLFSTLDNCVELAHFILSLSKAEAEGIRQNARAKSLFAGYSYKARADTAFQALKFLLS